MVCSSGLEAIESDAPRRSAASPRSRTAPPSFLWPSVFLISSALPYPIRVLVFNADGGVAPNRGYSLRRLGPRFWCAGRVSAFVVRVPAIGLARPSRGLEVLRTHHHSLCPSLPYHIIFAPLFGPERR